MTVTKHDDILTRDNFNLTADSDAIQLAERLGAGIILLIDKPGGWTSFDVVNKIKKTFRIKKVGHAGTLDPIATGLLIICTAKKTKEIDSFVNLNKLYTGIIKLGETTASYDTETEVLESKPYEHIIESSIYQTAESLTGVIEQVPPMYSAVKKNGKRLYKIARKGKEVERSPRTVTVSEFNINKIDLPFVSFEIRCSKGTYIRTLAHDMGQKLGTGGHITELRRTAIGSYSVENAVSIDQINELKDRLRRTFV